jgi:hypothetical protein
MLTFQQNDFSLKKKMICAYFSIFGLFIKICKLEMERKMEKLSITKELVNFIGCLEIKVLQDGIAYF